MKEHQKIEIIFTEVCKLFEADWRDFGNIKHRKFDGNIKRAKKVCTYLLSYYFGVQFAAETMNIGETTARVYSSHISAKKHLPIYKIPIRHIHDKFSVHKG